MIYCASALAEEIVLMQDSTRTHHVRQLNNLLFNVIILLVDWLAYFVKYLAHKKCLRHFEKHRLPLVYYYCKQFNSLKALFYRSEEDIPQYFFDNFINSLSYECAILLLVRENLTQHWTQFTSINNFFPCLCYIHGLQLFASQQIFHCPMYVN